MLISPHGFVQYTSSTSPTWASDEFQNPGSPDFWILSMHSLYTLFACSSPLLYARKNAWSISIDIFVVECALLSLSILQVIKSKMSESFQCFMLMRADLLTLPATTQEAMRWSICMWSRELSLFPTLALNMSFTLWSISARGAGPLATPPKPLMGAP